MALTLCAGDQDVLWFDVSMNDLEAMEMSKTRCDLAQCTFWVERDRNVHEVIRTFDDVSEGRGAEFDGNVEEIRLSLLIEVSNNVGVVVGFLEDVDFSGGQGHEVSKETFDSDSTAL